MAAASATAFAAVLRRRQKGQSGHPANPGPLAFSGLWF
jgi:hypothetical protein